jgi:hypothetical protein
VFEIDIKQGRRADLQLLLLLLLLQVQEDYMDQASFEKKFVEPINRGQARDATPAHKGQMTKKLSILQAETAVSATSVRWATWAARAV